MAVVVVGGQARKVGKTSVVCGLIAALPERRWTAIKLTQHGHGESFTDFEAGIVLREEHDRSSCTDTSRYLAAGAEQAFWVRVRPGHLAEQMPRLRDLIESAQNTILESNSLIEFLHPELALCLLDPSAADFKPSALRLLERADALVVPEGADLSAPWPGVRQPLLQRTRCFRFHPPLYCTEELVAYVAAHLSHAVART